MSTPNTKWIEVVSKWLDSKFTIPGTKIKFGLDPLFSIVPAAGDLVTYIVSLRIIFTVKRNGASGELLMRMLINSSVDVIFGSIPIVGTVFDIYYRSNEKNLKLLKAYYEEGKYQGSGKFLLALVLLIVLAILVGLVYLTVLVLNETVEFLEPLF